MERIFRVSFLGIGILFCSASSLSWANVSASVTADVGSLSNASGAKQYGISGTTSNGMVIQTGAGKTQILPVRGLDGRAFQAAKFTAGGSGTTETLTNTATTLSVTSCIKSGNSVTTSSSGTWATSASNPNYICYCCSFTACTPGPGATTKKITSDGTYGVGCGGSPVNGAMLSADPYCNVGGPVATCS